MFSKDITSSDAFREMPPSTQALYFHLGMEADDDGFLDNYRGLMRAINSSDDDLKILLTKRFLIVFPSKVIVVKHWLLNNTIRQDRYKETKYLDEKLALIVKQNGSYSELGKPSGNQVATQYRIGEDSIEKKRPSAPRTTKNAYTSLGADVLKAFEEVDPKNKTYYSNTTQRKACDFLISEYGLERVLGAVKVLPQINKQKLYLRQITTPYELQENWVKIINALAQKKSDPKYKVAF